ncbi:MAG: class II glutamine amidotransferase [Myxococcales bacterium]|nr:class II glutamine amidotransferase [Myxococcales bacterium]
MSHLFAIVTNDTRLFALTQQLAEPMFRSVEALKVGSLGLGYHSGGHILLQKRPIRAEFSCREVLKDIRTNRLICHIQDQPTGPFNSDNTQPFRYKDWLFAMSGTLGGGGLIRDRALAIIPDYLRRNINGDLPPELVFHLFLTYLYIEAPLSSMQNDPEKLRRALSRTLQILPDLAEERGQIGFSVLLSNGEYLLGGAHRRPMVFRTLRGADQRTPEGARFVSYPWMRTFLVSNTIPDGEDGLWTQLADEHLLVCDGHFETTSHMLLI